MVVLFLAIACFNHGFYGGAKYRFDVMGTGHKPPVLSLFINTLTVADGVYHTPGVNILGPEKLSSDVVFGGGGGIRRSSRWYLQRKS